MPSLHSQGHSLFEETYARVAAAGGPAVHVDLLQRRMHGMLFAVGGGAGGLAEACGHPVVDPLIDPTQFALDLSEVRGFNVVIEIWLLGPYPRAGVIGTALFAHALACGAPVLLVDGPVAIERGALSLIEARTRGDVVVVGDRLSRSLNVPHRVVEDPCPTAAVYAALESMLAG